MRKRNFQLIKMICVFVWMLIVWDTSYAQDVENRLPREVWIATVSGDGLRGNDEQDRVSQILQRMESIATQRPDLGCLPELFAQIHITASKEAVQLTAQRSEAIILKQIQEFAKKHHCNVVCPIYVIENDNIYNSAVVVARNGEVIGRYDKVHTTIDEMKLGVKPGRRDQGLIETDIGSVGIQICYDIEWHDGWERLKEQGAEIIVWPSAFGGGEMVKSKAWQTRATVVSATGSGLSRVCDCTGDVIAVSSRWNYAVVAPVNLERSFLHTWPSVQKFPAIQAKYGTDIRIRTFAEEEWSILESRSKDIKVKQLLKEFDLETRDDQLQRAQKLQDELRLNSTPPTIP